MQAAKNGEIFQDAAHTDISSMGPRTWGHLIVQSYKHSTSWCKWSCTVLGCLRAKLAATASGLKKDLWVQNHVCWYTWKTQMIPALASNPHLAHVHSDQAQHSSKNQARTPTRTPRGATGPAQSTHPTALCHRYPSPEPKQPCQPEGSSGQKCCSYFWGPGWNSVLAHRSPGTCQAAQQPLG